MKTLILLMYSAGEYLTLSFAIKLSNKEMLEVSMNTRRLLPLGTLALLADVALVTTFFLKDVPLRQQKGDTETSKAVDF